MLNKVLTSAVSVMSLVCASVQPAQAAGTHKGYFYGAKTPSEVAQLIVASLAKDASGRTLLSEDNCRTRGGCATPLDYLQSFQAHDPQGAPKTLAELPGYLRTLVIKHNLQGEYQMDYVVVAGSVHRAVPSGMSRPFRAGEAAWVNPVTGRPVLAEWCGNPIGVRIKITCVIVNFENQQPMEHAVAWARYNRPDDECFAYRMVSRSEEADAPTAVWNTIQPGCLGRPCNFHDVNAVVGREPKAVGMIPLTRVGHYQIRLSPDEFLVLCLKLNQGISQDGQTVFGSFASGVRWQQDYRLVNGYQQARVRYSTGDMRSAGLRLNDPRGLAFWASDENDQAAMRGLAYRR